MTPEQKQQRMDQIEQRSGICRECKIVRGYRPILDYVKLCERHAAMDDAATSMRSRCVEKVKSKRAEWLDLANHQTGWCQHVRAADSIIEALESVSIQEQENRDVEKGF